MKTFKVGDKVTYKNGNTEEKGIVKKVDQGRIYVVYRCNNWANYASFTAAFTPVKFLQLGW